MLQRWRSICVELTSCEGKPVTLENPGIYLSARAIYIKILSQ
jgi:hypothetical protein